MNNKFADTGIAALPFKSHKPPILHIKELKINVKKHFRQCHHCSNGPDVYNFIKLSSFPRFSFLSCKSPKVYVVAPSYPLLFPECLPLVKSPLLTNSSIFSLHLSLHVTECFPSCVFNTPRNIQSFQIPPASFEKSRLS